MDSHSLTQTSIFIVILFGITFFAQRWRSDQVEFPDGIPIVGVRKQFLSKTRASLRQLSSGLTTLLEGYGKFAQHGRPFVVYDPSGQQELLLPVQFLKWFTEQPDSKLSSYEVRQERHALRYLQPGSELTTTTRFIERISGDRLTRNLQAAQPAMYDEIRRCIDNKLGVTSTEWTEINVYSCMQDVVMPTICRIFLGLSLCRQPHVVSALSSYITALGIGTILIGELPRFLKLMIAPLARLPLAYYRRKNLAILSPVIKSQMSQDDEASKCEEQELSFIRQCIKLSKKSTVGAVGNTSDSDLVVDWILSLAFAGSSSTVIQATNLLLDVVNATSDTLQLLREEAETILLSDADWHKESSFKKQVLADSAIRESLRFHPILIKGLTKEVVPSAGITLPDGTHMPKGGWLGVPVHGIHRDAHYYADPNSYEPFRFVKTPLGIETPEDASWEDDLQAAKPTTTYLGFGYGRHACPGRWFAVIALKMILSYIILNYDIEATASPPKPMVIGDAALPPLSSTIRVRRRTTTKL